jgi:hypothetical protein
MEAALLDIRGVLGSGRPGIRVTFGLPQSNLTYLRYLWLARGPRLTDRFKRLFPARWRPVQVLLGR